jgi:hypothetical protein
MSERGRPSLNSLLKRNRVFFSRSYLDAERWLYLISPSDRALLLQHDFAQAGVLAIFDRAVFGLGVQMKVTDVTSDSNGDLTASLGFSAPRPYCVFPPGQPAPDCPALFPVPEYTLVAVTNSTLMSQPTKLYANVVSAIPGSGIVIHGISLG